MDPKNWNWKLIGAGVAVIAYLAWKGGGLNYRQLERAMSKNIAVSAAIAAIAYFGLGFVLNRAQPVPMPGGSAPAGDLDMPPEAGQLSGYMPQQQMQQPHQMGQVARGPGGMELTEPFGC